MEVIRVAANTNAVIDREFQTIYGAYLVAGGDNASASIFDALTQTGTAKMTMKALANSQTPFIKFDVPMRTGISITLTGTAPVLYLLVE